MLPNSDYDPNCLDKYNDTIANIEKTLSGIKDFEKKFQQFQDDYKRALTDMARNMAKSLCPRYKKNSLIDPENHPTPTAITADKAAELLFDKKKVVILTGAGLSAASGIPTFRGAGGFWTERNKTEPIKAQEFLTYRYYQENPKEIWRWHHEFKKLQVKCSPNASHRAIAEYQINCKKIGVECNLITQNIDNYHIQALLDLWKKEKKVKSAEELKLDALNVESERYGFFEECYEIHGNGEYIRCDSKCCDRLFPAPKVGCDVEFIPDCPKCGKPARPHTLLFDEQYNEEHYRQLTVTNHVQNMDCLIVIGTALETNLAQRIVGEALDKKIPIVEVNTQPIIEWGNVFVFEGKAENFIPKLLNKMITLNQSPKDIKSLEATTSNRKSSDSSISTNVSTSKSTVSKSSQPSRVSNPSQKITNNTSTNSRTSTSTNPKTNSSIPAKTSTNPLKTISSGTKTIKK